MASINIKLTNATKKELESLQNNARKKADVHTIGENSYNFYSYRKIGLLLSKSQI